MLLNITNWDRLHILYVNFLVYRNLLSIQRLFFHEFLL